MTDKERYLIRQMATGELRIVDRYLNGNPKKENHHHSVHFEDMLRDDEHVSRRPSKLQMLGIALLSDDRTAVACLLDDFGEEFSPILNHGLTGEVLESFGFERFAPPEVDSYSLSIPGSSLAGETVHTLIRVYRSRNVDGWSVGVARPMPRITFSLAPIKTVGDLKNLVRVFGRVES